MVVKECKIEGRYDMENKNLPGFKTPRVSAYTEYGRVMHFNTSCFDE
jgi:hypothetical protein